MDSSAQCLLEFHPWLSDRVMGLNHQLAALSCAIAEAVALNRTLVFPEALCISVKHELRWHAKGRQPSPGCVGEKGVTGFSVPTSTLIDLDGIRRLVPIELRRLDIHPPPPASHDAALRGDIAKARAGALPRVHAGRNRSFPVGVRLHTWFPLWRAIY